MVTAIKSKILLSLAILRELYNKVGYYRLVIDRNIKQYNEYSQKISKIAPERIGNVEREIAMLKTVDRQLSSVSIFLEHMILRLETLTLAGNTVATAIVLKDVAKTLKRNMEGVPPIFSVLVDKLEEITRGLIQDLQAINNKKSIELATSEEALKIVEEAKKIAGIK